jgi:tRNA (guanine37-N1)-methyltransferase
VKLGVITLFPDMLEALTGFGVTGRSFRQGNVTLHCWNPRSFTRDKHQTVDDRPYGGGPGMVMMAPPLAAAIRAAKQELPEAKVIYMSPQGRRLDQPAVKELATREQIIILCGRYEGIDERLLASDIDEEWSIGDYVLSGGELAAMVLIDGIVRLLPGTLGDETSAEQDSFSDGLLDYPHYTRPEVFEGAATPAVLLSGNHREIARWRLQQSLMRTSEKRPDLLTDRTWTAEETRLMTNLNEESAQMRHQNMTDDEI